MVKKFMAALLAAALFLCSVPVFADYEFTSQSLDLTDDSGNLRILGIVSSAGGSVSALPTGAFVSMSVPQYNTSVSITTVSSNGSWPIAYGGTLYNQAHTESGTVNFVYNNGSELEFGVNLSFIVVNNSETDAIRFDSSGFQFTLPAVISSDENLAFTGISSESGLSFQSLNPSTGLIRLRTESNLIIQPGDQLVLAGQMRFSLYSDSGLYTESYASSVFPFSDFSFTLPDYQLGNFHSTPATDEGLQDIEDSLNHNHQDTVDQFEQATNPDQAQATTDVDNAASDLESFEDGIFTDINTYKADLDFSLDSWVEASAGLDYVRKIFMVIWNNSPSQIIVLSLMLGLAMYLLGRGPSFQRAEAAAARRERRNRGGD